MNKTLLNTLVALTLLAGGLFGLAQWNASSTVLPRAQAGLIEPGADLPAKTQDERESAPLAVPRLDWIGQGRQNPPTVLAWTDGSSQDVLATTKSVLGSAVWSLRDRFTGQPVGVVAIASDDSVAGVLMRQGGAVRIGGRIDALTFTADSQMLRPETARNAMSTDAHSVDTRTIRSDDGLGRYVVARNTNSTVGGALSKSAGTQATDTTKDVVVAKVVDYDAVSLVLGYSTEYENLAGSAIAARNQLVALVELSNLVLSNSQVGAQLALVGMVRTDYPISMDNSAVLSDLAFFTNVGNETPTVMADLRAKYGADIVGYVRPFQQGYTSCGVGYINGGNGAAMSNGVRTAYFVADNMSAAGMLSCTSFAMAHELGHVFGQDHDPAHAPGYPNSAHNSFGYGYTGFGQQGGFSDVMGYPASNQIYYPFFSNPNLGTECAGTACGTAANDVARSLNLTQPDVLAWGNNRGGVRYIPSNNGVLNIHLALADPAIAHTYLATASTITSQNAYGPGADPTNSPYDDLNPDNGSASMVYDIPGNTSDSSVQQQFVVAANFFVTGTFRIYSGTGMTPSAMTEQCQGVRVGNSAGCQWVVSVPAGAPASKVWVVVQGGEGVAAPGHLIKVERSVVQVVPQNDVQATTLARTDDEMVVGAEYHFAAMAQDAVKLVQVFALDSNGNVTDSAMVRAIKRPGMDLSSGLSPQSPADWMVVKNGRPTRVRFWVPAGHGQKVFMLTRAPPGVHVQLTVHNPSDNGVYQDVNMREVGDGVYVYSTRNRTPGWWSMEARVQGTDGTMIPLTTEVTVIAEMIIRRPIKG